MHHSAFLCAVTLSGVTLVAAPVPPDARVIVAGLNDPSTKVRDEAVAALTNRPDAAPWVRRATRSDDRDTSARAAKLLGGYTGKRQLSAKQALDARVRDRHADLFVEWHHFWQPDERDEVWSVGPKMGKAAVEMYAQQFPKSRPTAIEGILAEYDQFRQEDFAFLDGPFAKFREVAENRGNGPWRFRTDELRLGGRPFVIFASVAGPIRMLESTGGYYFALGGVGARDLLRSVFVFDGDLGGREDEQVGVVRGPSVRGSVVVCRGNALIPSASVRHSILLVDGDIDLSESQSLEHSVIRASGGIRLKPGYEPVNCKIEARAKDATAPYKFFELADVGLSVVDDEEGMVVAQVKPGTPFGNSGLKKGDVIQAIDDVPPGHSSEFRKSVRRAMVRQGDCLLSVARGREKIDLPVYFPPPK
jgi:hypothetical protein